MTLGSLFDGSGGFPLAGLINGITPIWASEIEPYPLRVTAARFPMMKQLGDVTKINGAEIQPVDIITFGSPCQDLSVAGAQKGIHDGKRSNLFFEAIRIIREMRGATNGKYPRFAVWENVPGAFSSNKGQDFRAVLEAFCQVCATEVSIPEPPKGKWQPAGCIVGDGYSIAWRVYDAQYWGVPQRRKRIYLVADFAGERAGEILFERESVRGYPAQSREAREGTAGHAEGSAGGSRGVDCVTAFHLQQDPIPNDRVSPCIGGQHQATIGVFMGGQGAKAGGIGYSEDVSPTIKSVLSGSNTVPDVVYALQGNGIDRADTAGCNGKGWRENECYTLNTIDRPAVVYAPNGNHCGVYEEADVSATLQTKYHYGSGGDAALAVYDARGNGDGGVVPTLTGDHQNRVTDYTAVAVYPQKTGALCANSHPGSYTGQDAFNDMLPVVPSDKPPRKYIVRRLTPLECCRLQGFPDWWETGCDDRVKAFRDLRSTWPEFDKQFRNTQNFEFDWNWYRGHLDTEASVEGSDSARYKMWGNGIALPCAVDVLGRISKADA